jgi:hypothetical protein
MKAKATMNNNDDIDILWGAEAIGKALGISGRRAHYLIEKRELPVKRIGGRWCITRARLREFFEANADAA